MLLLAAGAAVLVLRSGWFHEQVRVRLVSAVETATGGRVAIGSFAFDWRRLRAEIRDFTLHGTEPAGKPPLLHADSIAVGLKIVSHSQARGGYRLPGCGRSARLSDRRSRRPHQHPRAEGASAGADRTRSKPS